MNGAPHAGVPDAFEITVTRKAHVAADATRVVVLQDFILSLPKSGFVALIGPSGCGKTTLLRIAAGLDQSFVGKVRNPEALRLGVVFQEPRLLPWRNVAENIALARPAAMPDNTADLADRLGFTSVLSRYPSELSLGLARRVSLARALAIDPGLLLLDEPFVSLDGASADRLREVLAQTVGQSGATVLMVTHDVVEAIGLADTLIVLSERPARILARIALPAPRGRRTIEDTEAILAEVRKAQATAG
ncbi:ABC transporter ATP-binding protein [Lichenifustis flavocetrariae]|uniref:ATP-binding cassette domain-containing protein n=1 Tax=Lichenifustis flavocetrariae TaxID=2949735 RepID=A0AA41YR61_9HYPH|nr:ATP-binding cassette domain-containing protein [Lichenifustis flavocetrariae]MCW6506639.1 ATP-binding cassette domain-containing protein [Lichenifustis flavocetrariae]